LEHGSEKDNGKAPGQNLRQMTNSLRNAETQDEPHPFRHVPQAVHDDRAPTPRLPPQVQPDLQIIRILQQRLSKLQEEKENRLFIPTRIEQRDATLVQIVYEVYCHKNNSMNRFSDKPLAYGDNSEEEFHLHGQKPFPRDIDLFVERQRGAISFIIFKGMECCKNTTSGVFVSEKEAAELPDVKETIRVTSQALEDAFEFLRSEFKSQTRDFPEFKIGYEIQSPFLWYFQKRSFMVTLDSIPDRHLSQIRLLSDHIERSFGDHFARIDYLISRGKITNQYLPYLFEPGGVVVEKRGAEYMGFEQDTWPTITKNDTVYTTPSKYQHSISCQAWGFEGEFFKTWQDISLDFGDPRQPLKAIKDLNILPLRFAEAGVKEELLRRGSVFWKCRFRSFVSYKEHTKGHDDFKVSDSLYGKLSMANHVLESSAKVRVKIYG
jgi:hypothetical protein